MTTESSIRIDAENLLINFESSEIPAYLQSLFEKREYDTIIGLAPPIIEHCTNSSNVNNGCYAMYYYALSLMQHSEYAQAKKLLLTVLDIAVKENTDIRLPSLYNYLGIIERNLSNFSSAREWYEKALEYYRKNDDIMGQARIYNNLGMLGIGFGTFSQALHDFTESLNLRKKHNVTTNISAVLNNIGLIYLNTGRLFDAIEYFTQSLQIERENEDNNGIAICLLNIGSVYESLKDFDQALEYYRQSMVFRSKTGNINGSAHCLSHIGNLFFIQNMYEDAQLYFTEARDIKKNIGDKNGEANYNRMIGECFSCEGKYSVAMQFFDIAESVYRESNNEGELHNLLLSKAKLYSKSDSGFYDFLKAESIYDDALTFASDNGDEKMEMNIRKSLADFYEVHNDPTKSLFNFKKFHNLSEKIHGKDVLAKILTFEAEQKIERIRKEHESAIEKNRALEHLVAERTSQLDTLINKENNFRHIHEAFVRHISHEFRTPLTAVTLGISVIEKIVSESEEFSQSDQILAYCRAMNTAANSLRTILDSAQTLTHTQTSIIDLKLSGVAVASIVLECATHWRTMSNPKQKFDIRINDAEARSISNAVAIENIVRLLLENARMYSPEHATITLTISTIDKNCEISVHNTHSFIPPEDREHIFDVFYRGSQYRELKHGGLGIGLTLCTLYSLSIGAAIECISSVQKGTEFILKLPTTEF